MLLALRGLKSAFFSLFGGKHGDNGACQQGTKFMFVICRKLIIINHLISIQLVKENLLSSSLPLLLQSSHS